MEVLRVKEVRFRLRLPTGFKYNDSNYNEIDYEISRQKNLNATSRSIEVLEINDLGDSDDDVDDASSNQKNNSVQSTPTTCTTKVKPPFKKSQSVQQFASKSLKRTNTDTSIEVPNLDDSEDDEDDDDDVNSDSEDSGDIVVS